MKKITKLVCVLTLSIVAMLCLAIGSSAAKEEDGRWIAAWGTGPTDISLADYNNIAFVAKDISARTVITPTANGSKLRIRLSNYYGSEPLNLESVTVAQCVQADNIDPNKATSDIILDTLKVVTFNDGQPFVTIPVGKEVYSDPINFEVKALKNIAISMYAKKATTIRTMGLSGGTSFLTFQGDKTRDENFGITQEIPVNVQNIITSILPSFSLDLKLVYKIVRVVPCVVGLDVFSDEDSYAVAVVGDSTVANEFPLYLAEKINSYGSSNVGVMGKAIIGNMLGGSEESLGSNLYGKPLTERFAQDIQAQSRIKYVVVKIGANDIIHPVCGENADASKQPSSDDLINYLKKICKMSHDMGAKVILCTITQWKDTTRDYFGAGASYVRTEIEFNQDWQIAKDVNEWIMDPANKYHDGCIDFTSISADPKDSARFDPNYTSDFIHPNNTLQRIWADNFPMGLIGVTKKVGTVKLNASSKTIYTGDQFTLKSSVIPSDAENKKITWTTSNSSVLQIVKQGSTSVTLKALKNGKATITATSTDGSAVSASCKFTVKTHASSVKLNKTALTIYTRGSEKLKATVAPAEASDKSVKWTSSNKSVATVSSSGTVKAVSKGTATITCTTVDGSHKAQCKVTVKKATDVTGVKLSKTSKTIVKGDTYQLTYTVLPTNATFQSVTWSSTDEKVAKVSSDGIVTAVKSGTAYIICRSKDNTTATARTKITVKTYAQGVSISPKSAKIVQDATKQLTAVFTPSDTSNKNVKWSSKNSSVAKVSKTGLVTAVKPGTTTITCKSEDGSYIAECSVTVIKSVKVKKITLNASSKTVTAGKTFNLTAKISPENANFKTLKWTSSNTKVAKVNSKGVVTAVGKGKATITCTNEYGKVSAKCKVTVNPVKPTSVKLSKTSVNIVVGRSYKLKATVNPSYADNKKVKWTSSNTSIATVSSDGTIKAKKIGSVTITCKTLSGAKTATCKVKVLPVKATSVKLNKTNLKISYSWTYTLKATVSPSNTTNKAVKWSSSDKTVATVDKNGKVTAKGEGVAIITCKSADGGNAKAATCKVTVVKKDVTGIQISDTSITLNPSGKYKILAKATPNDASDRKIIWKSLNEKVATVSSDGTVKAIKPGRCLIQATTRDGNYNAYCLVVVSN